MKLRHHLRLIEKRGLHLGRKPFDDLENSVTVLDEHLEEIGLSRSVKRLPEQAKVDPHADHELVDANALPSSPPPQSFGQRIRFRADSGT